MARKISGGSSSRQISLSASSILSPEVLFLGLGLVVGARPLPSSVVNWLGWSASSKAVRCLS